MMSRMATKPAVEIWVGTRKGAFVFRSRDRKRWESEGPFFKGEEVCHVARDPRDPQRLYAAAGTSWFGPHLHASRDGGKTWALAENGLTLEKSMPGTTLARFWHIAPGAPDEPGTVYLGADPAILFRTRNHGEEWEMLPGLSQHPTRDRWNPGAGGMMVHSIESLGKGRIVVGISAAGAFRSSDDGATWEPFNAGVLADFSPDKYPEVGQCVHKLRAHPRRRTALYQQNHCGVYRAAFTAKKWIDCSRPLPTRFGFGMAVPAAEEDTMFTVPICSSYERYVPEGRLQVGRSRDGGKTWELLSKGLPQENAYILVLREAMAADARDPAGVYFGTTSGTVFYTRDAGDSWHTLAEHLPQIYSVSASENR